MHTAKHLVSALSDPLCRGRTVILATHHIKLCLPISSFLVELFQGAVRSFGSVDELRKGGYLNEVIQREDLAPEAYKLGHMFPSASSKVVPNLDTEVGVLAETPPQLKVASPSLKKPQHKKGTLIEAERKAEGRVSYATYWIYIRAAGVWTWIATVFLVVFMRLTTVVNQVRGASSSFVQC